MHGQNEIEQYKRIWIEPLVLKPEHIQRHPQHYKDQEGDDKPPAAAKGSDPVGYLFAKGYGIVKAVVYLFGKYVALGNAGEYLFFQIVQVAQLACNEVVEVLFFYVDELVVSSQCCPWLNPDRFSVHIVECFRAMP